MGREYAYQRCCECAFVWCDTESVACDDDYWDTVDIRWRERDGGIGQVSQFLLSLSVGTLRVLDYGCGKGTLVRRLRELGHDAVGVDPLEPETEHTFRSVARTGLAPGAADAVTAVEVFEHLSVDEARAALREIRSVLAPAGMLLVTTPFTDVAGALVPQEWWAANPPWHRSLYSHKAMFRLLSEAGFEWVTFPDPTQVALGAVRPPLIMGLDPETAEYRRRLQAMKGLNSEVERLRWEVECLRKSTSFRLDNFFVSKFGFLRRLKNPRARGDAESGPAG